MKKTYYILGANFVNKGAEAMMYTTISEIKKKDKNSNIVVMIPNDDKVNKDNYLFEITNTLNICDYLFIIGGIYKVIARLISILKKQKINKTKINSIKENDIMIDISGFSFSSKWGFSTSIRYLLTILAFNKKKCNIILMPQSFGPFNYSFLQKKIIYYFGKKSLPLCKKIYTREKEGYDLLINIFKLKNVEKSLDMVLQTKSIDYTLVFKNYNEKEYKQITIKNNSVAIVPNVRVIERANYDDLINLYIKIIKILLKNKKNIYLLYHSTEDIDVCKKIKEKCSSNDNVIIINKELSSIEYSAIISKFDFIIGSRFHSIVHAYKELVPSITIGWAIKYYELMKIFNQEKYCINIKNIKEKENILFLVENMINQLDENKLKIKKGLVEAQKNTCFNILDEIK